MSKDKRKINLQDYGPVSSFSTSIISGLLVGLLVQNFIGFEPVSYTHLTLPTSDLV